MDGGLGLLHHGHHSVSHYGLITSRDRAMDVLKVFDRAVAERRQETHQRISICNNKVRIEEAAKAGLDFSQSGTVQSPPPVNTGPPP